VEPKWELLFLTEEEEKGKYKLSKRVENIGL